EIRGLQVTRLGYDPWKILEPEASGLLRANPAPELIELIVFAAHRPRAVSPRKLTVIALDRAIDPERREERVGGVGHSTAKAGFVRKAPGAAPADASPESKSLKHVIFLFLPRIEAKPPYNFRLVGRVIGQDTFAVECSHPILDNAARNVPVNRGAGAAECCRGGRVEKRRQRSF